MGKPKLVYVTYIATTREHLWRALTDPEMTARYGGHRNVSKWTRGDTWEHRRLDDGAADLLGRIIEIEPPRRLVHTWAFAGDAGAPAKESRVTYDIEPVDEVVRLTFDPRGSPHRPA